MKFSQLPVNETFTFEGEKYRKVSPIIAVNLDTGNQRMISRAAMVSPGAEQEQGKQPVGTIGKVEVKNEFARFNRQLQEYIAASDDFVDREAKERFSGLADMAGRSLLKALDID